MATIEELCGQLQKKHELFKMDTMATRHLVDDIVHAAREEGHREGCIEKDTEWRRGYNQGWEERRAFDQPGGALPAKGGTT